jgi:hypothetical protein
MATWLPIVEYSIKTGVSVSTIRRKIKTKALKYRTENGKYLILDENTDYEISPDKNDLLDISSNNRKSSTLSNIDELILFAEKSINRISELNKDVIKEKDKIIKVQEDHIIKLREQIDELKMLVSILEKKTLR